MLLFTKPTILYVVDYDSVPVRAILAAVALSAQAVMFIWLPLEIFVLANVPFARRLRHTLVCLLSDLVARGLFFPLVKAFSTAYHCSDVFSSNNCPNTISRPVGLMAGGCLFYITIAVVFVKFGSQSTPFVPNRVGGLQYPCIPMHIAHTVVPGLILHFAMRVRCQGSVPARAAIASLALGMAGAQCIIPFFLQPLLAVVDLGVYVAVAIASLLPTTGHGTIVACIPGLIVGVIVVAGRLVLLEVRFRGVVQQVPQHHRMPGSILKTGNRMTVPLPKFATFPGLVQYLFYLRQRLDESQVQSRHAIGMLLSHAAALKDGTLTGRIVLSMYHATVDHDVPRAQDAASRTMTLAKRGLLHVNLTGLVMFVSVRTAIGGCSSVAADGDTHALLRETQRMAAGDVDEALRAIHLFWHSLSEATPDVNDLYEQVTRLHRLTRRVEAGLRPVLEVYPDNVQLLEVYVRLTRDVTMEPDIAQSIAARVAALRGVGAADTSSEDLPDDRAEADARRWRGTLRKIMRRHAQQLPRHNQSITRVRGRLLVMQLAFIAVVSVVAAALVIFTVREERFVQCGYDASLAVADATGAYQMIGRLMLERAREGAGLSAGLPTVGSVYEQLSAYVAGFESAVASFAETVSSGFLLSTPATDTVFQEAYVQYEFDEDLGLFYAGLASIYNVTAALIARFRAVSQGSWALSDHAFIFGNVQFAGMGGKVASLLGAMADRLSTELMILIELLLGTAALATVSLGVFVAAFVIPTFLGVMRDRLEGINVYLHLPVPARRRMAAVTRRRTPVTSPISHPRAIRFADEPDPRVPAVTPLTGAVAGRLTTSDTSLWPENEAVVQRLRGRKQTVARHLRVLNGLLGVVFVVGGCTFIGAIVIFSIAATAFSQIEQTHSTLSSTSSELLPLQIAAHQLTKSTLRFAVLGDIEAVAAFVEADLLRTMPYTSAFKLAVTQIMDATNGLNVLDRYHSIVWMMLAQTNTADRDIFCQVSGYEYNYTAEPDWSAQDAEYGAERPHGWYSTPAEDAMLSADQATSIGLSVLTSTPYRATKDAVLASFVDTYGTVSGRVGEALASLKRREGWATAALSVAAVVIILTLFVLVAVVALSSFFVVRVQQLRGRILDIQTERAGVPPGPEAGGPFPIDSTDSGLGEAAASKAGPALPIRRLALHYQHDAGTVLKVIATAALSMLAMVAMVVFYSSYHRAHGTTDVVALTELRNEFVSTEEAILDQLFEAFDALYVYVANGDDTSAARVDAALASFHTMLDPVEATLSDSLLGLGSDAAVWAIHGSAEELWGFFTDNALTAARLAMSAHGTGADVMPTVAAFTEVSAATVAFRVQQAALFPGHLRPTNVTADLGLPESDRRALAWALILDRPSVALESATAASLTRLFTSVRRVLTNRCDAASSALTRAVTTAGLAAAVVPVLAVPLAMLAADTVFPENTRRHRIIQQRLRTSPTVDALRRVLMLVARTAGEWVLFVAVVCAACFMSRGTMARLTTAGAELMSHRYMVASVQDMVTRPHDAAFYRYWVENYIQLDMDASATLEVAPPVGYQLAEWGQVLFRGGDVYSPYRQSLRARFLDAFVMADPDLSSECGLADGLDNEFFETVRDLGLEYDAMLGARLAELKDAALFRIRAMRYGAVVVTLLLLLRSGLNTRVVRRTVLAPITAEDRAIGSLLEMVPPQYIAGHPLVARFVACRDGQR
ncbi:hypothetical protein J8273_8323 [Carpediemonas membranifera]|uniref:TmcB/TmcC TPR repeats domain-containing protein n=1 Tax=Carpediemonas membranifera TaxID=201153 RepID=A0A8J6APZ4_9EUKA|nr:hypothetical protein J8273_8323 [Carpediemonas membranifera]|eukprot:KAG9390283.1 hypothetical protein J8273_8323 [Carpediemonas membranifera]